MNLVYPACLLGGIALALPWLLWLEERRNRKAAAVSVPKGAAALQLSRTTCPQGHPLSGDNVYVPPVSSRRQRQCRTCRLAAKRRYNARKRAAA